MRLSVARLLLPLLLLCCDCFATVHLESGPGDHNSISKTTSPNEAMITTPKVPFGMSVDDPSTNSVAVDFPCPDAEAIAPCICTVDSDNKIYMHCTLVESEEQLATVFQQEFPVKDLYQFHMDENSAVTLFSSFMNGVTFESLDLNPGPFVLERISEFFLLDLKDTLTNIYIRNSKLQTDFFPFDLLHLMKLQNLHIHGSDMNWIPEIRSPYLTYFAVDDSPVETLASGLSARAKEDARTVVLIAAPRAVYVLQHSTCGAIQVGMMDTAIVLNLNQIHTIEPGSIFFAGQNNPGTIRLTLYSNQLTTVDEAVFGDLMPYISSLTLHDNPLTCGCDIAWLVLNVAYMSVVDKGATCADGTNLHALDPQDYMDFCRR